MLASLSRRQLLVLTGAGASGLHGLSAAETQLTVVMPEDVLRDYQRFLGNRRAESLREYGGPHSRRDVIEVVLLHQALATEGTDAGLGLQSAPTSARLHRELSVGHAACSGTSYWRRDFPADNTELLFSRAVLEDGEVEAGLYTVASNKRAMAARKLADVQGLSALCNRDWQVDWQSLQQLGLRDIQHAGNWELMPRMLVNGRADFVLAPFQSTPDLSLRFEDITLVPIPGIKVQLRGTRHFLLSARHPGAADLKKRLDLGLERLRRSGALRRAYTESGFFNPSVANWVTLGRT